VCTMSSSMCIINMWETIKGGKVALPPYATYIRETMEEQDVSQVELEARTGIADSTLSRYLKGTVRAPKATHLVKIADALNLDRVRVLALAGITTERPVDQPSAQEAEAIELLKAFPWMGDAMRDLASLRPEDRQLVQDFLQSLRRRGGSGTQ
jgi:transcriptional regulator with XRE-family HTH domain